MFRHFTRVHFKILLGFVVVFSALSAFWLSQQSPGDRTDNSNLATAAPLENKIGGGVAVSRWPMATLK